MEPRTSRNANCARVLCLFLAQLVAKSVTQNFARVLCLSLPHLVATSVTQIFAIVLCLSLPHLVAKSGTQIFAAIWEHILGRFLPSESSQTSPKIYNAQNAKRANRAYVLRGASAQSATAKACSTTMGRAKKGGRLLYPQGGYN